jgi:hypothetical protein
MTHGVNRARPRAPLASRDERAATRRQRDANETVGVLASDL